MSLVFTTLKMGKVPSGEVTTHCNTSPPPPTSPLRDLTCSAQRRGKGTPKTTPWVQPAWHAELRGPPHFCPSGSALHSFLALPGLTSSTFTLAGSFSRALTSSMERVRLQVGGSVLPHGRVMIGFLEGLLPPPQPPQRRQCLQSPMPSCSGLLQDVVAGLPLLPALQVGHEAEATSLVKSSEEPGPAALPLKRVGDKLRGPAAFLVLPTPAPLDPEKMSARSSRASHVISSILGQRN